MWVASSVEDACRVREAVIGSDQRKRGTRHGMCQFCIGSPRLILIRRLMKLHVERINRNVLRFLIEER
jgi:hypothetical protein